MNKTIEIYLKNAEQAAKLRDSKTMAESLRTAEQFAKNNPADWNHVQSESSRIRNLLPSGTHLRLPLRLAKTA